MNNSVNDKEQALDFEASLNELEKLVDKLEQGDLSLEESLKDFERGVKLTRACQQALGNARQQVQILLQQENGESTLADFTLPDDDSQTP